MVFYINNTEITDDEAIKLRDRLLSEYPIRMDAGTVTPGYYKAGGVETIDYLHAFLTEDEFNGFCKGNIIKYVSRANRKNGVEDIRKARDYIRYLITSMEGEWS